MSVEQQTPFCTACGCAAEAPATFCVRCGGHLEAGAATSEPQPRAVPLPGRRLTMGSAAENDVVLEHETLAAQHVEISAEAEGLRLRDLSRSLASGTRLNGQLVSEAMLADGDVITIGPWAWTLRAGVLEPALIEAAPLAADAAGVVSGAKWLLRPTTLTVHERELVAVIGPSGAGKSTLLHLLAGLRTPSCGAVRVHGDDVSVRQPDIAFVPQEETVHHGLTVREALHFAAQLRMPTDGQSWGATVDRVLADVDLLDQSDQRIATLSGGQRKRVALAQELVSEPSVVLLDEPTSGLDPGLDRRMMLLMRALATAGRSVVVVTHSVAHVDMCDRIAVMAPGGSLAYLGRPDACTEAFGVGSIEEIFEVLAETADAEPVARTEVAALRPSMAGRVVARRQGVLAQGRILTRRYGLLMLRDRRNLRLLAAQAVGLSVGSALLFSDDVFAVSGGAYRHAAESAQLVFLMVTMALWFGAVSAARQIVAERAVLRRELAAGIGIDAYLLSKGVVLGALAATQSAAMAFIVFSLRPLSGGGSFETVLVLMLLVSWVGMALGLLVSAFARSEDQATSFIPLVLLPQLLFGGAIVPISQLSGLMSLVSRLAASQWAFAATGHAIHMNARIAGDPVFSSTSRYGSSFFGHGAIACGLVLVLCIAACAVVLQWKLRPSFEDTWFKQSQAALRTRRHARRGAAAAGVTGGATPSLMSNSGPRVP